MSLRIRVLWAIVTLAVGVTSAGWTATPGSAPGPPPGPGPIRNAIPIPPRTAPFAPPFSGTAKPRALLGTPVCGGFANSSHQLVNKLLSDARRVAEGDGCVLRVVEADGVALTVTDDYRPMRINVATRNGVVDRIVGQF